MEATKLVARPGRVDHRWSAMTIELPSESPEIGLNRLLTVILLRVFSGFCLLLTIAYWASLVGFEPIVPIFVEIPPRFDLMPGWWRIAVPILAVLYPIAGISLWMTARWAPVVWGLVILVEAMMHIGFPILFGSRLLVLALHVWGIAMYGALRLLAHRDRLRQREARRRTATKP